MTEDACFFGMLAATSISACANPSAKKVAAPSLTPKEDPLGEFRLPADADMAIWARHLEVSRLKNKPQMLALSGGGEDGTFGAGALNGWSQTGKRPDFDIVTGVSTGAMIAPFAFLGARADNALRHMFLDHGAEDIMRFGWLSAATSSSLFDTTPLARLIKAYTPDAMLDAIAQKHGSGARLFVATANLGTSKAIV